MSYFKHWVCIGWQLLVLILLVVIYPCHKCWLLIAIGYQFHHNNLQWYLYMCICNYI